ncbi:hypothetical protein D3C81_2204050 [compost metagenome]
MRHEIVPEVKLPPIPTVPDMDMESLAPETLGGVPLQIHDQIGRWCVDPIALILHPFRYRI